MPDEVLLVDDLAFRWSGSDRFSLSVPTFGVARAETVLLLGDSGSGKSTLLSLICGTITPERGRIEVAGTDITKLSGGARDRFRAEHIGVIFQQFNLLPFATVTDNILLPLRFAPARRDRAGAAKETSVALCNALGLPGDIGAARASALSVGQQQRVAVARALIGQPPLIIADEPTSALDENSRAAFLDVLFKQVRSSGSSLLMVSHDTRLGEAFDRVVRLQDIAHFDQAVA